MENLSVAIRNRFGQNLVLDGVDLEVSDREVVGLVGESGCGKSLTAKSILGILPEAASVCGGRILFKETDLLQSETQISAKTRQQIAFIPQDPASSLNPLFKIEDQVFDLIRAKLRDKNRFWNYASDFDGGQKREMRELALDMFQKVRLTDSTRVLESYPWQLSGGMKQRVLIAMALLGGTSLLIADEPTSSLDVSVQDQILELIEGKVADLGISMLLITHDLGVAKRVCDRIYVMYAGNVVEEGTSANIIATPKHPYTSGLLDAVPRIVGHMGVGMAGFVPDPKDFPSGCRFNPRCPFVMKVCSEKKPRLLEVEERHLVACHLFERVNRNG